MSNDSESKPESPATPPLPPAHCSADRSKFKPDWFTPAVPAMCLIQGVLILNSKSDSLPEMLGALLLGMLLIYTAFFNLVNVMRRNPPNAEVSHE